MDIPPEILEKATDILINHARNKGAISYAGLYNQIGLDHTKPLDRLMGSQILGAISRESVQEKDIMLSSLAFGKYENEPFEGFYDLAQELGKLKHGANEDKKYDFWTKQMYKCWEAYSE
jgi:hypothetical protein